MRDFLKSVFGKHQEKEPAADVKVAEQKQQEHFDAWREALKEVHRAEQMAKPVRVHKR